MLTENVQGRVSHSAVETIVREASLGHQNRCFTDHLRGATAGGHKVSQRHDDLNYPSLFITEDTIE